MAQELSSFQCIPKAEFDPTTLTGTFQVMNDIVGPPAISGFGDDIKVFKLYNPSTTISVEISYDGVTPHDFMPPMGTCIIDFQTNHSNVGGNNQGTLNGRRGQQVWGRTATNPTFIQMIGFR